MEDTTKPDEGAQRSPSRGLLIPDPGELLISDDAAWKDRPPTKSALGCGSTRGLGMSMKDGDLVSYPLPCRSYGHRACAEKAVKKHLEVISRNLRDEQSSYGAILSSEDFDNDLLRDRLYRYRLKHPDDTGAWYRSARRDDDTVWIFGTLNLTGRLPPTAMGLVEDLMVFAAEALRLPGVLGFRGTPWRVRPDDAGESDLHSFGPMVDEEKEVFLEEVAAEVQHRHGITINPSYPVLFRGGVTVEQYIECGDAVRDRG